MSSGWIALVASIIVAIGGGGGYALFRTIKETKGQLLAGARKLNAEADGQVIDNMQDVLRVYIDELKNCQTGRAELRLQLEEAHGIIQAQGKRLGDQDERIEELQAHVAQLERRKDWRRDDG